MADDSTGTWFRPTALAAQPWQGDREDVGALTRRIRNEFAEMPGTCLTAQQACRLFGIPREVGTCILHQLVAEGVLHIVRDGRYQLRSATT